MLSISLVSVERFNGLKITVRQKHYDVKKQLGSGRKHRSSLLTLILFCLASAKVGYQNDYFRAFKTLIKDHGFKE